MHIRKNIFKIVFIIAMLLVGIAYSIMPHFVRYNTLKELELQYIPVTQESNFDMMNVQAGRYRDMIDGKMLSGEVDTYEHKDGPSLWPLLSSTMLAPFFIPFDTIFPGIIITDFLFPIFIFSAFFLIFKELTADRMFALFSAVLLMLFPQFPHYIPPSSFTELKLLILQFSPLPLFDTFTAGLTYLTRESFIPGGPFFILSLYFVYKAVSTDTKKKFFILLAGIFYGILFYLYFYFWAFATVFLGLFFIALLLKRKTKEAVAVFAAGVVGLIVSIPFWISHFNLVSLSNYQELIDRMGPELDYGFRWFLWKTYILVFLMAGLTLWIGRKFNISIKVIFLITLALSEIVVLNMQVITGFNIQSDHWGGRVFLITRGIIWLTIFYYLFLYFKNRISMLSTRKTLTFFAVVIISVLFSNVVYTEIVQSKTYAHFYTVDTKLVDAYEWLNKNTPKDSVVMTPSLRTNIDLPVYTHNRIFLARANNSIGTEEELLNRLYITYIIFGIPPVYLYEMIQSDPGIMYFFSHKYASRNTDVYLRPYKYDVVVLPVSKRNEILNEYVHFQISEYVPYRVNYLFIGPREYEIGINDNILDNYQKIYDSDGIKIFKVGNSIQ